MQMPKASLKTIVKHCDKLLRTEKIGDYDGAVNGLQAENAGSVTRIAAAVDASLATVKLAIAARADLLIVHHGLFWSPAQPWTGKKYELLRLLVENNLAVYSSHLPLDAHPRLGNNAQFCAALGLKNLRPFFVSHGHAHWFSIAHKTFPARNSPRSSRARPARNRESFPAARKFAGASAW
jgi:putative NIF3 family GTP cyclohydrolase 1 type 2